MRSGCSGKESSYEVLPLEGRVEKIDARPDGTGTIMVLYFSEKHNQEMIGAGEITKETEIMINGAVATLKEIREGERVRGEVRVEKKGQEKRRVALKIYVDRPKPVGGGQTGDPAGED